MIEYFKERIFLDIGFLIEYWWVIIPISIVIGIGMYVDYKIKSKDTWYDKIRRRR